jgi:hypothetical protein
MGRPAYALEPTVRSFGSLDRAPCCPIRFLNSTDNTTRLLSLESPTPCARTYADCLSESSGGHLTYFAFDLLELEGEDIARLPLLERKNQLAALLGTPPAGIEYSDHEGGEGEVFPARGLPAWARRHRFEAAPQSSG